MRVSRYVCPSGLELFQSPLYLDAEGVPVRLSWAEKRVPWLVTLRELLLSEDSVARGRAARAAEAAARGLAPHCPRGHVLPEGYLERPTVALGVVGLTSSGKTTFITSLVETLLRGALDAIDVAVTMDEASAADYQLHLRRTLILDKERLPLTQPAAGEAITDRPLVLRLSRAADSINLLVYDASGEQLYRKRDIGAVNPHLYCTRAIMLALSPAAFPGIEHLDNENPGEVSIAEATQMVTAVGDVVRKGRRLRRGEVVEEVSVAVVVTKSDKLIGVEGFPIEHFGNVEEFIEQHSLEELFRRVREGSDDIVEFLRNQQGKNITNLMLDELPRTTFHLVSATGHDVGADGHYPSIDQVGVVEPLITLLARVGFLPAEGLPLQ